MKKAPKVKIGCKACNELLDTTWINESGFMVKIPQTTSKVTNIIGEKKKKSSKTVSLF